MAQESAHTRRNVALAVLGALVLWFAWSVRSALNPLLVGFLLAFILHPMVAKLERRGWSRMTAVNTIFGCAALIATLLAIAVFFQARELWNDVFVTHGALQKIQAQVGTLIENVSSFLKRVGIDVPGGSAAAPSDAAAAPGATAGAFDLEALGQQLRDWLSSDEGRSGAAQAGLKALGGAWVVVGAVFGSMVGVLTWILLVPLYSWFLLFELERITSFVGAYVPLAWRPKASRIAQQIGEMLGTFFRGRLMVCLLKGILLTVLMVVLRIPYPLLLGLLAGFLSLIPFVGPAVGYGLVFLIALLNHSLGETMWRTAVVVGVAEIGEGYVLMPKVLGKSMGLHPLVVLASFMIFGTALGTFGLLVALPLTSTVVILARELVLPALREVAEARTR